MEVRSNAQRNIYSWLGRRRKLVLLFKADIHGQTKCCTPAKSFAPVWVWSAKFEGVVIDDLATQVRKRRTMNLMPRSAYVPANMSYSSPLLRARNRVSGRTKYMIATHSDIITKNELKVFTTNCVRPWIIKSMKLQQSNFRLRSARRTVGMLRFKTKHNSNR